jgi:hypothetical protein
VRNVGAEGAAGVTPVGTPPTGLPPSAAAPWMRLINPNQHGLCAAACDRYRAPPWDRVGPRIGPWTTVERRPRRPAGPSGPKAGAQKIEVACSCDGILWNCGEAWAGAHRRPRGALQAGTGAAGGPGVGLGVGRWHKSDSDKVFKAYAGVRLAARASAKKAGRPSLLAACPPCSGWQCFPPALLPAARVFN